MLYLVQNAKLYIVLKAVRTRDFEFEPFLRARVLICGGGRPVRSGEIESE